MPGRILILDDEERLGVLLQRSLERGGYDCQVETAPEAAIARLKSERYDVLVTDLRMPGMSGIDVLDRAKAIDPELEVILMTAFASVDTARDALKRGAADYLVKPFSAEEQLKPLLEKLLAGEPREEKPAPTRSERPPIAVKAPAGIVLCDSPAMQAIYRKLPKIAQSDATVLLRGESGTGKEVLSDLLQRESPRAAKPYVKVNCGALPDHLLESELFGHAKGAFTGAHAEHTGLFEAANGGTILLDEIGEVSPPLQVKLLRVLQSGDVMPVGETRVRHVDVRVIAATNRPLEDMIKAGTFREDLYYRLNVVPVTLPPLRERPEDLERLIESFAKRFAKGRPVHFSDDARRALQQWHWPGNIRELENAIEHAIVLGDPEQIVLDDLPAVLQASNSATGPAVPAVGAQTLEDIEKNCLLTALRKTGGNRTRASKLLGITRRTLGYRLRKYDLEEAADRFAAERRDEP